MEERKLNYIDSVLCKANGYDLRGIDRENTRAMILNDRGVSLTSYNSVNEMAEKLGEDAPIRFSECNIGKNLITFKLERQRNY